MEQMFNLQREEESLRTHAKLISEEGNSTQAQSPYLYWLSRATITKYHRLGGLSNVSLFSHTSGGSKSKTKVSEWIVSSEVSLLDL